LKSTHDIAFAALGQVMPFKDGLVVIGGMWTPCGILGVFHLPYVGDEVEDQIIILGRILTIIGKLEDDFFPTAGFASGWCPGDFVITVILRAASHQEHADDQDDQDADAYQSILLNL
jgi:hypothetical protein